MIGDSCLIPDLAERFSREAEPYEVVHVPCPGCGSEISALETKKNGFSVVRCLECSCLYVNPRPIEPQLVEIYRRIPQLSNGREGQSVDNVEDGRREAAYRLRRMIQFVKAGRLLDLGCGRGDFLTVAHRHFDAVGVDIVNRTRPELSPSSVFEGRLEDARFDRDSFDAITAVEVFEHLFDPRRTLREIHRILRPGGMLLLQTGDPDGLPARMNLDRWSYLQPPIHLNFLGRRALHTLFAGAGFRVLRAWSFGRAPQRTPVIARFLNSETLRPLFDLTARVGVLGQMYAVVKEAT